MHHAYACVGVMQMICAWNELISILPQWLRQQIVAFEKKPLEEIRMRVNSPPELVCSDCTRWLTQIVQADDIRFCVNAASRYSPWAASTVSQGYITAQGGHRIGLCGEAVIKNGFFAGFRTVHSLCIRIARDFSGAASLVDSYNKSILILGAPGWGKTTLLRDLARKTASDCEVGVVDERRELFPDGFPIGKRMDILYGCPKHQGIETLLRTMTPEVIAVDEITAEEDCKAIINAIGCGIRLLATAHASGMEDYQKRCVYNQLRTNSVFDCFLILHPDKTYHMEAAG